VLLNNGYVVAEGAVHGVRDQMDVEHPMQILIRCNQPSSLAARLFQHDELVEARVHDDRHGLFVKTRTPDRFYLLLNEIVANAQLTIESIAPVDDDLSAVYEYLIGDQ
jgi:ABC-2 type transport system ATP-binding protein